MAAFMRPLASSDDQGESTLRPGTEEYHEAKSCECCAATPAAAPLGPLRVGRWVGKCRRVEGGVSCYVGGRMVRCGDDHERERGGLQAQRTHRKTMGTGMVPADM